MVPGLEVARAPVKEKTPRWVCSENTSVSEPCTQTPTMVRPLLHYVEPCSLILLVSVNSFSMSNQYWWLTAMMWWFQSKVEFLSLLGCWGFCDLKKESAGCFLNKCLLWNRDMNAGGILVCLSWICSIIQMLRSGSWAGWRRSWACPWKRSRCDSVKQTVMLASLALGNATRSLYPPPLGLSRPSGVGNHMGRVETWPEIHPAQLPHRRGACFSGVSSSLSKLKVFSRYHLLEDRFDISLFSRNIGNTTHSAPSKMRRETFLAVEHRTWNVWRYSGYKVPWLLVLANRI